MAKVKWTEEPFLKCEISLDRDTLGDATFIITDKEGDEFEITAPTFTFNYCTTSRVGRIGNLISVVGTTRLEWSGDRLTRIGDIYIVWSAGRIIRIGNVGIQWGIKHITKIGQTPIVWSGNLISRVGRAAVYSNGSVSGPVK